MSYVAGIIQRKYVDKDIGWNLFDNDSRIVAGSAIESTLFCFRTSDPLLAKVSKAAKAFMEDAPCRECQLFHAGT